MTGSISRPHCSVIIRAYNEADHIWRLLTGINRQNVKDVEIILVDSGSTDQTINIAKAQMVRIVHISPEEFTFGRSLNRGIAQARSDFIIIASAHVYPVYPDWLERLLAPFQDPNVALTYGKQRGNQASYFTERQIFQRWYPDRSELRQAHPFCNNANAAIRRVLWEQHPYDEALSGLEDIAWARWAIDQGYLLSYVSEAEVIHVHNETPRMIYNRYRREAMAFKRIFPQENFHLIDLLRLVIFNVGDDLFQAVRQKELRRHFTSIFWFRWNQFWGTYQGYRQPGALTEQLRQTFYYPQGIQSKPQAIERSIEPINYPD
jgi:glycosyltransferase involved in cell wall biosynthesis